MQEMALQDQRRQMIIIQQRREEERVAQRLLGKFEEDEEHLLVSQRIEPQTHSFFHIIFINI